MQVGPIKLMKSKTFSEVMSKMNLLWEENSRLATELGAGLTTHSFMHYPWHATTAPKVIQPPDQDSDNHRDAVARVIAAYSKAAAETIKPASGMWDDIEARNKDFMTALQTGDAAALGPILAKLFQSQAIWGLGKFDENLLNDMKAPHEKSHLQLRITDALVSLGQAVGVKAATSIEQQGVEPHIKALSVDLNQLAAEIETAIGFALAAPAVGATYGCTINNEFITLDGVINTYVAHRLKQLGVTKSASVVEIGGGFGCLSEIVARAIGCQYHVYDLPWVSAIQGYYLIMSLPQGTVKLFGESTGNIEVLPFWHFDKLTEGSIEFIVNSDSLPEMGYDTARSYIEKISKNLRGMFLSINQEAQAKNANSGKQNCVHAIAESVGGLRLASRSIYWMRQGYVEEVFTAQKEIRG
ncbi:MAG TPA: putative sugar O-methyltransferase [Trichormus sp.]|jgi:putative sugar O-methyltransferase